MYGMGDFKPEFYSPKENYQICDEIKVGYVGSLDYAKLNSDVVLWIKRITEKEKRASFYFAGDCLPDFKHDIEKNKLNSKVHFLGFRNDIPELLKGFDVFVYPLNPHNFATTENALIEAMAVGLPIIASRGVVEEAIIANGKDGILVENEEEFVSAFTKIMKDEKKRIELGHNARKDAIRKYSIVENLERYHKVIEKVKSIDKHKHNFSEIFGGKPHEWFFYGCSSEEKMIIEKSLIDNCYSNEELLNLGAIFWGENKGSVEQFYQYDKTDTILNRIHKKMILERTKDESKNRNKISQE